MKLYPVLLLGCCWFLTLQASEQDPSVELVSSAQAFLGALSPEQQEMTRFPMQSQDRMDWHYFPKERPGLSLGSMDSRQKELVWKFFRSVLSQTGYEKARGVLAAEMILWEASGHSEFRDPGKYYVCFFGKPESAGTWGARLEGHHLSINITVIAGKIRAVTPSFMGSDPDRFPDGSRPLAGEYDQVVKLVSLLSEPQLKKSMLPGKVPREIITRAERQVSVMAAQGLPVAEMSDGQKEQLFRLMNEYIHRYRKPVADQDWAKIRKAGVENIHFCWAGKVATGKPLYYRIQGPTFLMEYANAQRGANHSHTVWRDFANDFGLDVLKQHFESHPHE